MDDLDARTDATLRRLAGLIAASPHNLVSRSARSELLTRHVPESVALARLLPDGGGRLLDVGSGGGLPGMVIAIVRPDYEVHLLDSTHKKTAFLSAAAEELEVTVTVHTGRAERLATPPLADSFDVVTARAVASLDRLLPLTLPFLGHHGVVYAVKGERWREEVDAVGPQLARLGAQIVATPDDLSTGAPGGDDGTSPRVVMIGRAR